MRLAAGMQPDDIYWPNLGYADAYTDSYKTFHRLGDEGVIPAGVRFQVQYPTLADSDRIVGQKVGVTSKAMQQMIGIDSRDYGPVLASTVFRDGDKIPLSRFIQPQDRGRDRVRARCGVGRSRRERDRRP